MFSTWQRYMDRHYEDVKHTIQLMGYQYEDEQPKIKRHARPARGGYVEGSFGKPTMTVQQRQRIENLRVKRVVHDMKTRLTDLDDMCWQYGLTLEQLLGALVPICLPVHGGWRRKAQRLAARSLRGRSVPPLIRFRLVQLTNQKCWGKARELARELGRRVTKQDALDWAQAQRMAATILYMRGPSVASPMDDPPGDLETYIRETDRNRERLDKVLRRGIMPYRILLKRLP